MKLETLILSRCGKLKYWFALLLVTAPVLCYAKMHQVIYSEAHVAWLMVASILVLFMTLPGLALFYGGLVRYKNALSVVAQCFLTAAIMALLWVLIGYDLCFNGHGYFIGHLGKPFLFTVSLYHSSMAETHRYLFAFFQMGFATIAPAIIIGGFVERMKFTAVLVFIICWEVLVYYPVAHWVWGGGFLQQLGVLDFAGGSVVHLNAGVAGLVAALLVGKRLDFSKKPTGLRPHNITFVAIGTAILWIGWFGFNSGSADNVYFASISAIITQVAAATSLITWMILDWCFSGKPSVLGLLCGAVSGLVAITPAAGYVGLIGAIIIGLIASVFTFFVVRMKFKLMYDDSLDAFGIHGIAGLIGSILLGVFFSRTLGGSGGIGHTIGRQLVLQLIGVGTVIIWSGVVSLVILLIIKYTIGLRVPYKSECQGLDVAVHGEEQLSTEDDMPESLAKLKTNDNEQ